jgi:hypothetical protein
VQFIVRNSSITNSTGEQSKPTRRRKRLEQQPNAVLQEVATHYLNSGDFNGISVSRLADCLKKPLQDVKAIVAGLIETEMVGILDTSSDVNPAIIRIGFEPKEEQLKKLDKHPLDHVYVYPRPTHLASVVDPAKYSNRPYVLDIALGQPQLSFRSFDLSVLEFYRNDPRYTYENRDIDGYIAISDEFYQSADMAEKDQILLQSFGFSFDKNGKRAVAVFLRYLADLSPGHQQIWRAKELTGNYKLHPDYFNYTVIGDWGEKFPIFVAFCAEMHLLNAMTCAMGRAPMFRQTFGRCGEQKPARFTFLVRPTLEEFNQFALLLDQMISDNINKDFFREDVPMEMEKKRADGKIVVRPKGTLTLLNDWLRRYFRTSDWKPWDEAFQHLKEVRRLRQKPAHAVNENIFDQKFIRDQRTLIMNAYSALRTLRLMFANHPKVKAAHIKIPDSLARGLIWTY